MLRIQLSVFIVLFPFISLFSQSAVWTETAKPANTKQLINVKSYRTMSVDFEYLKSDLLSAPNETIVRGRNTDFILSLPNPDGSFQDFSIVESSIMEAALQERYPNIRTFSGRGIGDNKGATIRVDFTLKGFHAQVLSAGNSYYIDPYSDGDLNTYIVYSREAFYSQNTKQIPSCEVIGENILSEPEPVNLNSDYRENHKEIYPKWAQAQSSDRASNGTQLRTYRLALACTGEYAQFHGGTVPQVLSAFTTSMNRVNGVFERDVSLRMVMISNTDDLIYLNGSTDPYSNNSGGAMLSQNQSTCDNVIGSANYDIGHVFSTGGGGVAYLASPCGSNKAGGVTGGGSPVGDPFDIDYVAHEMGHQWGANHTQNNSCNRSSGAAFEPGSASTIMGYAGICSPNLQSNSDAHFHNHSYNEMVNFTVNGNGNNCAVTSSTNNTPPSVSVRSGGFFIPKETAFELTGTATDTDGDVLTYCWEQYNLGPATASGDNNLTNPSGNAPIFRSWPPNSSPTRVFPRISDLVNNTTVIGEHLPTYSRDMTFRCTVRDNAANGGGVTDAQVAFEATNSAGPFLVQSPNSSVSWLGNSSQTVSWAVANTNLAPVNCSNVDIFLSVDGGYTYPFTLITNTPNDGSATVIIPNISTSSARIKVKASNNIFFDISNQNFIIQLTSSNNYDLAFQEVIQPSGDVCGDEVTPVITFINLGQTTITNAQILYNLNGSANSVFNWTGSLGTFEIATVTIPDIAVSSGLNTINVTVQNPNGQSDQVSGNNSGSQTFNVNDLTGLSLPVTNDFEGSFPNSGWSINNPDNDITWESVNVSNDVNCNSGNAATIDFYSYNQTGETDDIVSPLLNLGGSFEPELTFDYSYARYSNFYSDRMQVQILVACSDSWITLWDKENLELLTAGTKTAPHVPQCGEWASESIDLSAYAGSIVQIRFRGITGFGNNLYLDNINVFSNVTVDCAGVPNGTASFDMCGVCSGGDTGLEPNESCTDCNGVVNGTAFFDNCETCVGGDTGLQACVADCNGDFGGTATEDECGVCDSDPSNDNTTCLDCAGVINGTASIDECGLCTGGDTGLEPNESCTDCNGVVNGSAFFDNCETCVGGDTGLQACVADCNGDFGGTATEDECGVCDSDPSNDNTTCLDCAGVINGTASIDECGLCTGGDTGLEPNESCTDCNGVINGTAFLDNCETCVGGDTGLQACVADCNGDFGGTATEDECGVCDSDPSNDNTTCLDCAGVINGTASIDECGLCTGGDTGLEPNESCIDCNGVVNGSAFFDNCETCVGGDTGLQACVADCNGDFGGTATEDECGVCDSDPSNDNTTCLDCAGVINGTASIDECGLCTGGDTGLEPNESCTDCNGVVNGSAFFDNCETCVGGDTGLQACVADCNGDFGGTATEDECGVCDSDPSNDNTTCLDCAGVINGTASIDECGLCTGGDTGLEPNESCIDCNGVVNGSAFFDNCETCVGGNTGLEACVADCNGDFGGTATEDECGVCDSDPSNDNTTCLDCAGVINGTASIDECGLCTGGDTGLEPNESCTDCNGVVNGSAFFDNCETCVGGDTGLQACLADCNGDFGGTAYTDECGVCDSDPSNDNTTCLDCAGVINGTASIDECGLCTGGDTGLEPNESCTDCEGVLNGDAQPGTLCFEGEIAGIYSSDCNCEPIPNVTIQGTIDWNAACGSRNVIIEVSNLDYPELSAVYNTTVDENGGFESPEFPEGTYNILITVEGYLSKLFSNVELSEGSNGLAISPIIAGDLNQSNSINITDLSIVGIAFGYSSSDSNYNPLADFNCDGAVNIVDISILNLSFGLGGDFLPEVD